MAGGKDIRPGVAALVPSERGGGELATPGKKSLTEQLGSGEPIDPVIRQPVEQHLRVSLDRARVHTTEAAHALAKLHGARAFAHGTDIVLGEGESARDRDLIAHELAHVAQQLGGSRQVQAKGSGCGAAEQEADQVAAQTGAGPSGKIVDSWFTPMDGQITKVEALARAQKALVAMVEQEMGALGSARGCPYIQQWFGKHALTSAAEIEKIAQRFSGLSNPAHAADYIEPVVARARAGVQRWKQGGLTAIASDLAAAGLGGSAAPTPAAVAAAIPQVQAKEVPRAEMPTVTEARTHGGDAAAQLASGLGEGKLLDGATAARMEVVLGSSVADVRVHTDEVAQRMTQDAGARALAIGTDVAFAPNEYNPGTPLGDALLAHELAHTTQQRGMGKKPGSEIADERDANQVGLAAVMGRPIERDAQAQDQGLALRRCTSVPVKLVELHGKEAETKLTELGASLNTDPVYSDGQKALAGSAITFTLNTTPSKTQQVGIYQWTFDGPDGFHSQSAPNQAQPDPIPGAAPANGMFVNDHNPNATQTVLPKVGTYSVDAWVRAGVDDGAGGFDGYEIHIERSFDVIATSTATDAAYGKLAGKDKEQGYQRFHDSMDVQMALLRPGGPEKQNHGEYRIATAASNPVPAGPGSASFSVEDARKDKSVPLTYHWYVSPQMKDVPPNQLAGKSLVHVAGRQGYDFGSGESMALPTTGAGLWVVWYRAIDAKGADAGEASYLQTILGADDQKSLEKYDKYMERVDELAGKVQGPMVPLTGVHVSTANAIETRLRIFIGKGKDDPSKYLLVDLTPGLDPKANRLEYSGGSGAAVIDSFISDSKYPKGQMRFRAADNTINVPTVEHSIETTGQGFFDRLASGLSVGGMVVLGAGLLLAPVTEGQSLKVAVVVSSMFTAAGGAVSLYEHLQHAEVSGTAVSLDVLTIASSIINGGGAIKALQAGPGVLLTNRATKFLLWSNFAADGASALLISVDGVSQLAEVMNSNLPPEQQRAQIIRIVSNLIMAGAMLALSYGQIAEFRTKMEMNLGKTLAKELSDDVCMTLSMLDNQTLGRLKMAAKDDLGRLAGALREEPALMNILKSEERLAKILALMKNSTAEDLRFAIMRANAHEAGVSVANSERLASVLKAASVEPAAAVVLPKGVLARVGQTAALGELEAIGAAAAGGTLKGRDTWMASLLKKQGADLDSALAWGAEARKASAHDGVALDLSGTDVSTNAVVKDRSDLRGQMELKNQKLANDGQPARYLDLDAGVNTGMDNLAAVRKRGFPYGFKDKAAFEGAGSKLKADIAGLPVPTGGRSIPSDKIAVQGSAVHNPTAKDVDIAVLVTPDEFNQLLEQSFPKEVAKIRARGIDPFKMTAVQGITANERTLGRASEVGKLNRNVVKPSMRDVRKNLADTVGTDIDLSIIRTGGAFDHGPYFPFP